MRDRTAFRALLLLPALLLGACDSEEAGPATGQAPPAPEVQVQVMRTEAVDNIIEVPGRVQAVRTAEIRARVDGIIQQRLYREGSDVEAGAELFAVDPREMQASLSAVKATLDRAQATEANAAQDVERYKGLVEEQAISQQEYDTAVARLRTAQADVSQAKAQLDAAQLDLDYTTISSPIAGRAGRAEVTEGALVSAANGTLLTTVEQFDPVYVNFSQSSSELLSIRSQLASGELTRPENGDVAVTLTLENGSEFDQVGKMNFYAMTIDQATGTVALRAEFPNPDRLLLPGQFVNARIQAGTREEGMILPQRAVQMTEQGPTVRLVNAEDVVTVRPVEVGEQRDGKWIITSGLEPGDRVIISGLQKARPDQKVRVAEAEKSNAGAPGAPAQTSDDEVDGAASEGADAP
ncbi:efflux RND transporter periplasmic adaptor subunit [Pseudomonas sp. NyZ704]|nr:efflux RND transporter periplasmic adaptor subunit [Pseudomonas sp. NyZ704]